MVARKPTTANDPTRCGRELIALHAVDEHGPFRSPARSATTAWNNASAYL
jgi:hypothetical protein